MIPLLLILMTTELRCYLPVGLPKQVYAKIYYLHENPKGLRYVLTTPVGVAQYELVRTNPEGHPVAIEYWTRTGTTGPFVLEKVCGEVPGSVFPLVFKEGFEGGDLEAWDG